jgi:glutamate-1-semialdehyde 2,1-aminomutase
MRAGLASLEKAEAVDAWKVIDGRTEQFCKQLMEAFVDLTHPLDVVREGSIFWICLRGAGAIRRPDRIASSTAEWFSRFFHSAIGRGVYLPPSAYEVGFVSLAHDIRTLNTAATALIAAAREADTP